MKQAIRNLPVRMRQKKTSSGKVYFYYDTCAKPRKWLPLGSDFFEALRKYADYEQEYSQELTARIEREATFRVVAERYVRTVLPTLSPRTQSDYLYQLKFLYEYFDGDNPAPINQILSVDIYEYLEWRQAAKIRANREIALFSVIFNWARKWGYTNNENPCRGVNKYQETGRHVYITDEQYWRLYECAERHLQLLMLVAYFIGQRVADCLKIRTTDIKDGELWIEQNKVQTKVRIKLTGELAEVLDLILRERGEQKHDYLFVSLGRQRHRGQPMTYAMLRGAMDRGREKAGIEKAAFQFRDLRAKAATDTDDAVGIEAARVLLGHTTQNMTKRYIRNRKGHLSEPAVKLNKNRQAT